jgi:hypothetical protein
MSDGSSGRYSAFDPPFHAYGGGAGRSVIMQVVNRMDPEEAGRVQCRVFGYQNDKGNIPDSDLIWARPHGGHSNPQQGGIGMSHTGALENTVLVGHMLDGSQQLMYTGSLGASGNGQGQAGKMDTSGRNHSAPIASRSPATGGAFKRFDAQSNSYGNDSVPAYARNEAKNQFGQTQSPHHDKKDNMASKLWG